MKDKVKGVDMAAIIVTIFGIVISFIHNEGKKCLDKRLIL